MENKINRLLLRSEHVHHIDENKKNDNIENLEILTSKEHAIKHAIIRKKPLVKVRCALCKKYFHIIERILKRRMRINKMGNVFCSISCGASFYQRYWIKKLCEGYN